ncbi:MAG TPA: TIGR03435 family protein [Terriglobia bacterium]|jgi:uncharacterized protein (TIGR03435 family)
MRVAPILLATGIVVLALCLQYAGAQSARPQFEVASVKPNKSAATFSDETCHGTDSNYSPAAEVPPLGRCRVIHSSLKRIISYAYLGRLLPPQMKQRIIGGPGWMSSDRFDIDAKAEDASVTTGQLREMLQTLLTDRFKLQSHFETKETPGFALTLAKGGSKLVESKSQEERSSTMGSPGQLSTENTKLSESLVRFLNSGTALDGPVVDQTGLIGKYTFTLKWSPESGAPAGADPSGPSLFTALQEQLGLRLQPIKTTIEILVIDHAEKPGEN